MSPTAEWAGYACAALAACGNALANVMQRKASLETAPELRFGVRLLADLAQRATWLIGFGGMVASFVLQAVALGLGQLSAIEPVITLEVPLTLLVASRVFRTRLGRREWAGIWIMTLGMIVLVASLDPRPGDETHVSQGVYLAAGAGTLAVVALLILGGRRGRPMWRTACLGAAAGTLFGLTATLIKETVDQLSAHGIVGLVTTWQTYGAIAAGICGVVVMQWALHTGPLLAAQPGFTLMDPLVSILWGVLVYNEATRSGAWLVPVTLGGLAVVAGTFVLARSPQLATLDEHEEASASRPATRARRSPSTG